MTTYNALLTDIRDWLLNDDVKPETMIRLCEAELNRSLRLFEQEKSIVLTINSRNIALPDDFLQARSFSLNSEAGNLDYLPPDKLLTSQGYRIQGRPRAYTIQAGEFVFAPEPTTEFEGLLTYHAKIPALGEDNQTNYLFNDAYDLYLYGSLIHAAPFIKDTENMQLWIEGYNRAIESVRRADERKKVAGSPLKRVPNFTP